MPVPPYVIAGELVNKRGKPLKSHTITITNEDTGDTDSVTTNDNGQFVADLQNVNWEDQSYVRFDLDEDTIENIEIYVSIDNGNTWQYVINDTEYSPSYNRARTKVDLTFNPSGRTNINIKRSA